MNSPTHENAIGMAHSKTTVVFDNPIIQMEKPFSDARGGIQPLVDEDMKSAVLISSKRGTVRANHFHKTDWHYCYVLSGKIDYYFRRTGNKDKPKRVMIGPGQLFFTPPMVDHAMVFAEDTTFLCLGRNSREQTSYEADIERIELVGPAQAAKDYPV